MYESTSRLTLKYLSARLLLRFFSSSSELSPSAAAAAAASSIAASLSCRCRRASPATCRTRTFFVRPWFRRTTTAAPVRRFAIPPPLVAAAVVVAVVAGVAAAVVVAVVMVNLLLLDDGKDELERAAAESCGFFSLKAVKVVSMDLSEAAMVGLNLIGLDIGLDWI
ncbi:hypothetical protein DFJ73DRAFT_844206 [Zopfochytrium polystomum]|nr:hypothetical protein DFJ73DRAFT_844206 [Zopfochytrium polystomum]